VGTWPARPLCLPSVLSNPIISTSSEVDEDGEKGSRDLTVLALPDKVCLTLTAADLVLLEAAYGDKVGVCLAT
jgi:hypothetical protein